VKINRAVYLSLSAAAFAVAACGDAFDVPAFANDEIIEADMAASAGDAIATSLADMAANETQAGLQSISVTPYPSASAIDPAYSRTRTCYDAADAVVANCIPLAQVRRIVTHVTFDGTREGVSETEGGLPVTWVTNVHLVADDTVRRLYNQAQPAVETARSHSALITARDTATFTQGPFSRHVTAASDDSVRAVTWNLPHSQNPFPVAGKIIRMLNWRVTASGDNRSFTRDVRRRVEVQFPADAQGNVVLTINDKTCNLNLVTRVVSDCH
jgi:hypothetical protein